jgi:tripartite ATP-independent transporter DctM subunit
MEITSIIILILSFIVLISIGVPIAYSLGISGTITLLIEMPALPAITTISQRMATGIDSFALLAIPFFILAGQIMNRGGIATRLVDFAKSIVGIFPGGLAYVNILACVLFGAISGSASAAASAIGGFMGPSMKKEGYDEGFSAAVNATSATTGLLIPPSNILIVFSLASGGVSIAALFIAGYIPGILMGLGLMAAAWIWAVIKKYPRGEFEGFKKIAVTFFHALPSLFLLVIIMGGIVAGIFTATEASAIAVIYTLILALAYKEVTLNDLRAIILDTIATTAIVMLLVATSIGMSWVMSVQDLPNLISDSLLTVSDNPVVIILLMNLILLFIGIFMDMTPAVLIFTPIFLPVAQQIGIEPLHFGIMVIMNLCIGLCTPPVGTILFVSCSVAKIGIGKIIKPLLPLFLVMLIVLMLVSFVPEISLWLPNLFGY